MLEGHVSPVYFDMFDSKHTACGCGRLCVGLLLFN